MNELPTTSDTQASAQEAVPSSPTFDVLRKQVRILTVVVVVLAVLLLGQWWSWHVKLGNTRAEVASKLQSGETLNNETKLLVKSTQEAVRELQSKSSVIENKQAEAQNQQVALEQLYQELSRSRDDWALAEIEQVLSTASQQLQLAGNVQGALIALQNADSRLSRSDKPQFINVRRAIARDIERLKSLPSADLTGIALRLDSVIAQADNMPLLSAEKPSLPATPPKVSERAERRAARRGADKGKETAQGNDWLSLAQDRWESWSNEMWNEFRQLIVVRNVETPEALLLSPTQAYYVRENLKLRLMNARLALLSRNESAFRNDMVAAQDAIVKYFDTRARQTQAAQAILRQAQTSNLSIDMPTLVDSLSAVRNYKAKP